ncbi:hypothetical protein CEXT_681031 [Caerostris extrusa]|uniref:Uncharacterized protein n=1 Tax=Caerostris extrusa TaxID=172846 RepID=A0AAV4WNC8_CAEEX|nr:hypothetical protein CEXT_681031 [Caerostris extrusa]
MRFEASAEVAVSNSEFFSNGVRSPQCTFFSGNGTSRHLSGNSYGPTIPGTNSGKSRRNRERKGLFAKKDETNLHEPEWSSIFISPFYFSFFSFLAILDAKVVGRTKLLPFLKEEK